MLRKFLVLVAATSVILATETAAPAAAPVAERKPRASAVDTPVAQDGLPGGVVRFTPAESTRVSIHPRSLIAPNTAPFNTVHPGDIVVVDAADQSVLRTITAVTPDGARLVLAGDQVSLADLSEKVEAHLSWDLSDTTGSAAAGSDPGKHRGPAAGRGIGADIPLATQKWEFTKELEKGPAKLTFESSVEASATLGLDLDGHIAPFGVSLEAMAKFDATARAELTVNASASYEGRWDLDSIELQCKPLPYGLGAVCPTVKPNIQVQASASGEGNAWVQNDTHLEAGIRVDSSGIHQAKSDNPASSNTDYDWSWNAAVQARVTPMLDVEFHYLTHTGPYVAVAAGPYLEFTADTDADPWWRLNMGFNGQFRASGGAWIKKSYTSPLINLGPARTLVDAGGPFSGITVSPSLSKVTVGQTTQLKMTKNLTQASRISWSVVGPNCGAITDDGRYTAPSREGVCLVEGKATARHGDGQWTSRALVDVWPVKPGRPTATGKGGLLSADVTATIGPDGGGRISTIQVRTTQPKPAVLTGYGTSGYAGDAAGPLYVGGLPAKTDVEMQVRVANRAGFGPWSRPFTARPFGPLEMSDKTTRLVAGASASLSADGRKMAYAQPAPGSDDEYRWVVWDRDSKKTVNAAVGVDGKPFTVPDFLAFDTFDLDPTGRYLVWGMGHDLYRRDLKTGKTTALLKDTCREYRTSVKYAGGTLVYQCVSEAYMWHVGDKSPTLLTDRYSGWNFRQRLLDVSDDGTKVVYTSNRSSFDCRWEPDWCDVVIHLDRSTGIKTSWTPGVPPNNFTGEPGLSLSGDGKTVAVAGGYPSVLYVFTVAKGKATEVARTALDFYPHTDGGMRMDVSYDGRLVAAASPLPEDDGALVVIDTLAQRISTRAQVCGQAQPLSSSGIQIRETEVIWGCSTTDDQPRNDQVYRAAMVEKSR